MVVKVSEVINILKSHYDQILAIESNKEYSRDQKEELIKSQVKQ